MRWIACGCAVLVLAGVPLAASADTVVVNTTLDLTQTSPDGFYRGAAFSPPFSVAVAEGDVFDYTIDFLGAQTLTVTDLSYAWAFAYIAWGEGVANVTATGTLSFLDATGAVFATSASRTSTEGEAHIGQQFFGSDFAALPSTFTFYGVRYVGLLEDYSAPPLDPINRPGYTELAPEVTTRIYNDPSLTFTAAASSIGGVAVVPEPSTWAMMIAGFGLAGAVARRRRSLLAG